VTFTSICCRWYCHCVGVPVPVLIPEYLRLMAQGEFTEAYMVTRESNVFPEFSVASGDRPF